MIRIASRASGRAPFLLVASISTVGRRRATWCGASGTCIHCLAANGPITGSLPWKGERQQRADRGSFSPKLTAQNARHNPPNKEHTRRGNAHQRGSEQQRNPGESQNHDQEYKEDKAEGP